MDAYTFIKTAKLDYDLHNFSIMLTAENEKAAKKTFDKFKILLASF